MSDTAYVEHGIPDEVLGAAAALAAQVAAQIGEGALVLRALTGRTPLPAPYSIV